MEDSSEYNEDDPAVVVCIYDSDISDIMEDVQKALDHIGVKVKVTLVGEFPPERYDFKFEKVEESVLMPGAALQMEDLKIPNGPWEIVHVNLNTKKRPLNG